MGKVHASKRFDRVKGDLSAGDKKELFEPVRKVLDPVLRELAAMMEKNNKEDVQLRLQEIVRAEDLKVDKVHQH